MDNMCKKIEETILTWSKNYEELLLAIILSIYSNLS